MSPLEVTLSTPRKPAGRFLGPTGLRYSPMRKLPVVADQRETVDKIRAATSIRDEPECIGPAILEDYAQVADLHRSQQHALDVAQMQTLRPLLTEEDRLKDIQRRAKHGKLNLSEELGIMWRDLERARAGGRKPPKRMTDRLQLVEDLLDGTERAAA